jgi:hypothetical protein
LTIPDKEFFASGWQVPRGGDNNMASVYWLYNRTGEKWLLDLAEKLQRTGASWMKTVTGGHNVDFSQGFRKPAQFYQQSHDPKHLEASVRNWESIFGIYGQVPGGLFGGDEFARPGYTDPRQAIETCGVVEMMKSETILLRITGDPKWADPSPLVTEHDEHVQQAERDRRNGEAIAGSDVGNVIGKERSPRLRGRGCRNTAILLRMPPRIKLRNSLTGNENGIIHRDRSVTSKVGHRRRA